MKLKSIETLDDYLQTYGCQIGSNADERLRPLHRPLEDAAIKFNILQPLFPAQAHVATAGVKALDHQKSILYVCQMGTGKTRIAIATAHARKRGKPYRSLVFCPGHLVAKWEREIRDVVPDAKVGVIQSYKHVLKISRGKPTGNWWYIIGRDAAKLGASRRGAAWDLGQGRDLRCPSCGYPVRKRRKEELGFPHSGTPLTIEDLSKSCSRRCDNCQDPLYTQERTNTIRDRFEPARLIHKRLPRGFFDTLILDEIHEEKSDTSAQANAAGSLIAACRKVIGLTGTLIGGYADHVRPLLFRLSPQSLIHEGFTWGGKLDFSRKYGCMETITTIRENDRRSNSSSRGSSKSTTQICRPGIMPPLFGAHLMGNCIFLSLDEVADALPELKEEVIGVDMHPQMATEYEVMERTIRDKIRAMWSGGDRKKTMYVLGPMLQLLMGWPDIPDKTWKPVGYHAGENNDGEFVTVWIPKSYQIEGVIMPKEKAILDYVRNEKAEGRQCWIFLEYVDTHPMAQRLLSILQHHGLNVKWMKSDVPVASREEWIYKHGAGADVVISHPKLVETGLDLFAKNGNHNFPTLIFYEQGFNPFTMRQAAARAWRIGQPLPCKVAYLYYEKTMQARCMELMGRKLSAALAVEGKFSSEGLAAMAGEEGSIQMALARSLAEGEDGEAIHTGRAWERVAQVRHAMPRASISAQARPSAADTDQDHVSRMRASLERLRALAGVS